MKSVSQTSELLKLSLVQASELVRKKSVSPVELTRACLERIEELNPAVNAFITITDELALQQAGQAEAEIQAGNWRGPLHGVPIALKDLIDTAGIKTTAASAVFRDRIPTEDAEIVRRLRAQGALFLGKLNLHEFAYGASGIISHFGAVRNPTDLQLIAGGSSSGAAAAVAASMCFAAIGTDTAGSIRLPAAFCGIVGLKPTYGRVSVRGIIPLAWSYDHVGPLTRTVGDAAIVLQAIAGYDAADIGSVDVPVADYAATLNTESARDISGLRIGVPRNFFFEELQAEVAERMKEAIATLERLTAEVREVAVPVDTDRSVASAESWAFHANNVERVPELYQPETLRRIRAGAEITAATYIGKRRELEGLRRVASDIFSQVDVLITPTSPVLAASIAELEAQPGELRRRELLMLRNTRPFNVLGLPSISIPCGGAGGTGVGLQITARAWDEATVLRVAQAFAEARIAEGSDSRI